jgi:membrane protein
VAGTSLFSAIGQLIHSGYRLGRSVSRTAPDGRLSRVLLGRPAPKKVRAKQGVVFAIAEGLIELTGRLQRHEVLAESGKVAFYVFLAILPALAAFAFFSSMLGETDELTLSVPALTVILPQPVAMLLAEHATRLAGEAAATAGIAGLVSFALVLFSASSGVMALCDGLNVAFERPETRSLIRLRVRGLMITLIVVIAAAAIIAAIGRVHSIALGYGVPGAVLDWMRWPLVTFLAAVALAALYRHGPDRPTGPASWITVGSLIGAVLWVGTSHALGWYLATFPGFGVVYGSLATLAGFLFWVWLGSIAVLTGAEIDAVREGL